jgi:hypothetical protein
MREMSASVPITYRAGYSERLLPVAVALIGLCMTALSSRLLIDAGRLGLFIHEMLGFIGVIFVNSLILSFVAIRKTVSDDPATSKAERIILLGLSACTGVALAIAYAFGR